MLKLILLAFLLLPSLSLAASFDCTKASTPTEKLICNNDGLSHMDELMQMLYSRALKQTGEKELLKNMQLEWLMERDQACNGWALKVCEMTYLDGYRQLSSFYHQSVKGPLLDGMALPPEAELSMNEQASMFNPDQVGIYDEDSRPWLQKQVVNVKNGLVVSLNSAIVNETPYLLYVVWYDDSKEYRIFEYNLLTRNSYHVDTMKKWNAWISMQANLFTVVDGTLYYPQQGDFQMVPLEQQALMAYRVGSRQAAKAVTGSVLLPSQQTLAFAFFAASQDGRWLATVNDYLRWPKVTIFSNIKELYDYYQAHPGDSNDRYIYVYDRLRKRGYQLDFEQWEYQKGWAFGGLAFHSHLPVLFFDNHGPMACIWTYDLEEKTLVKIVPQHEAKLPRPFIYKGQDYVAFVISDEGKEKDSSIHLAAGKVGLE